MGRKILMGCGALALLGVLGILAVGCLAVLGSDSSPGEGEAGSSSEEAFTSENYGDLVADPEGNSGASVDVVGQVFLNPEVSGDELAFQIYTDPENADGNTLVRADANEVEVSPDDFVRVKGTVLGSFSGENAFGGTVTAVEIEADSVELVDATQAMDPAQETIEVGQTRRDKGFSVTVDKVEFGEETTRVYVRAKNSTRDAASFYTYDARIVQGSRQVDAETQFAYELPEPQSDLSPGVETEGIVSFGPVEPSAPFRLRFKWYSDNYEVEAAPLVFEISP